MMKGIVVFCVLTLKDCFIAYSVACIGKVSITFVSNPKSLFIFTKNLPANSGKFLLSSSNNVIVISSPVSNSFSQKDSLPKASSS